MKIKRSMFAGLALASLFASVSLVYAAPSNIQRILNAEAKPGEQARSHGDPHISYRVLENGMVEKIDDQYGTRKVFKPRIPRITPIHISVVTF